MELIKLKKNKKTSWIAINRHWADAARRVVKQINLSNSTQLPRSRLSACASTGCDFVGRAELTVENKSKQPSLLMTQYTSGRRGPFPVGWKRERGTKLVGANWEIWLEVRLEVAAPVLNLCLWRLAGSPDETGSGAKFPGQTPLCVLLR